MEPAGKTKITTKRRSVILGAIAGLVGVFALDGLLFHTNLYPSILDPDSSTGLFELILRREQYAQTHGAKDLVITLGNSRFAYSAKLLDEQGLNQPYRLRTAGVAGTNPRVWYYMLRDLDPTRRRYRAVVLALDDYDDEDRGHTPADDIRDLHYVIARLRLSDARTFADSFADPKLQLQAVRSAILKGIIFQADIRAFLAHPLHRFQYVDLCNREYAANVYNYEETNRSMAGLKIDWATLKVTFPPDMNDDQRGTVNSFLAHAPDPQTGEVAAYRRKWLGGIIDLYRGTDTKIIFLRLPRGPLPRPDGLTAKLSSSVRELASRPNVLLADEHAFDTLEHPELFKDGMHLNRQGIAQFSVLLAKEVHRLLDSPQQARKEK